MAKQSFSYVTRAAKWIERHVVLDALTRMASVIDLDDYRYVGLGGLEFVDFELFHRRLHITRMTSIDKASDERTRRRLCENKPFQSVDLRFGQSREVIPTLGLEEDSAIVWLDYESKVDQAMVAEVKDAARRLTRGSVLIVTANAEPDVDDRAELAVKRLGSELIEGFVAKPGSPQAYGRSALPRLQSEILRATVEDGAEPDSEACTFLNLVYADGSQMQTVAWLLVGAGEAMIEAVRAIDWSANRFVGECLEDPSAVRPLFPPMLTSRERTELNALLPNGNVVERGVELGLTEDWVERYRDIYRWYPRYVGAVISA